MRWDDLQLLRLIDNFETNGQLGKLRNGMELMRAAGEGHEVAWDRDEGPFVRELFLARAAGYVEWVEPGKPPNVRRADPAYEPTVWLQEIRDIRVTLAGRDRARGRVIQRRLPDPDEDDERPITGMTLEEIARAIGETYTGTQLPRFLRDSGVPEEFIPAEVAGSKWAYVLDVLERLHDGGSAARRTLREFIGGWLAGRLHAPPEPEIRKRIVALLVGQGWHVSDGRLVIGERSDEPAAASAPLGMDVRIAALHADIRQVADRYLRSGHPEVAIFEAFKAINKRVKAMTGLDIDGHPLMAKAFGNADPPIRLGDLSTETGRNVQAGYRFMFMGAVQGIRNPDAHELFKQLDTEEALETLAFASLLMRRLDESQQPSA